MTHMKKSFLLLFLTLSLNAGAQLTLDRHKIAGGGTSTGGGYSLSGTIGQAEATTQPLAGGTYAVSGGYWSAVTVVPVEGLPTLTITRAGGGIILSWPANGQPLVLQQNTDLKAGSWTASSLAITTENGVSRATIAAPAGRLFFRLSR